VVNVFVDVDCHICGGSGGIGALILASLVLSIMFPTIFARVSVMWQPHPVPSCIGELVIGLIGGAI